MSVHTQLTVEIARQLMPRLRPRYLALTTERFVMEEPESVAITTAAIYPDVAVTRTGRALPGGGVAIAEPPYRLTTPMAVPIPHVTVEIRDTASRQLVTAIEVLSPTNKRGEGRQEYLAKRQRILLRGAHLMEIDLLREGRRLPTLEPLPEMDYCVFLSRTEQRPAVEVWPIRLRSPLPQVPVPLLPGDEDVMLDLQAALTNVYDLAGYDLAADYGGPPEIPLNPEDAAWAVELLANRAEGPGDS